jgi:hypothetical protein
LPCLLQKIQKIDECDAQDGGEEGSDCCNNIKDDLNAKLATLYLSDVADPKSTSKVVTAEVCPICLVEYEEGDVLCWSQNSKCHHYFHRGEWQSQLRWVWVGLDGCQRKGCGDTILLLTWSPLGWGPVALHSYAHSRGALFYTRIMTWFSDCMCEWLLLNEECPLCRHNYLSLEGDNEEDNHPTGGSYVPQPHHSQDAYLRGMHLIHLLQSLQTISETRPNATIRLEGVEVSNGQRGNLEIERPVTVDYSPGELESHISNLVSGGRAESTATRDGGVAPSAANDSRRTRRTIPVSALFSLSSRQLRSDQSSPAAAQASAGSAGADPEPAARASHDVENP